MTLLIVKIRIVPLSMEVLEALLRRLSPFYKRRSEIELDYRHRLAGYDGEKRLDQVLKKLPDEEFHILNDLRLPCKDGGYFQIDSLLLTKSVAMILEAKNIAGELVFEKNQFTRRQNGETERFINPVLQAYEQARELKAWMKRHNLRELPIEYFFVNCNSKTKVYAEPGMEYMLERVCTCEDVHHKMTELHSRYQKEMIGTKDLQLVEKLLMKEHTPLQIKDILQKYQIDSSEILTGVQCPYCQAIPMIYKRGKWICPKCSKTSNTAHIPAINDFFLLYKPWITNAEIRYFLHTPSPHIARRILISTGLPSSGKFKARVYYQRST